MLCPTTLFIDQGPSDTQAAVPTTRLAACLSHPTGAPNKPSACMLNCNADGRGVSPTSTSPTHPQCSPSAHVAPAPFPTAGATATSRAVPRRCHCHAACYSQALAGQANTPLRAQFAQSVTPLHRGTTPRPHMYGPCTKHSAQRYVQPVQLPCPPFHAPEFGVSGVRHEACDTSWHRQQRRLLPAAVSTLQLHIQSALPLPPYWASPALPSCWQSAHREPPAPAPAPALQSTLVRRRARKARPSHPCRTRVVVSSTPLTSSAQPQENSTLRRPTCVRRTKVAKGRAPRRGTPVSGTPQVAGRAAGRQGSTLASGALRHGAAFVYTLSTAS